MPLLQAQNAIDSLKNQVNELHGKEKLLAMNELTVVYLAQYNTKYAFTYAKRAELLAENIITKSNSLITAKDYYLKPLAYIRLGQVYEMDGKYLESKMSFEKAVASAEELGVPNLAKEAGEYLQQIDEKVNNYTPAKKRGIDKLLKGISSKASETSSDLAVSAAIKLGNVRENNGNYAKAIQHYREAIDLLRDKGDSQKIAELQERIADLLVKEGNPTDATSVLMRIKQQKEQANDVDEANRIQQKITDINSQKTPSPKIKVEKKLPNQIPEMLTKMDEAIAKTEAEATDLRIIAERAENTQDFEKSLAYFKKYAEKEKKLIEERKIQELALLEKANEINNQEREITLLKQTEALNQFQIKQNEMELKKQRRFQQSLGVGVFLLVSIVLMLYLLYRNKKRDHLKISAAYQDLEVAQSQLKSAEQRIKSLLSQQVSKAVAHELMAAEGEQKVERRFVCVLFLDIRDFTPFVEKLKPEEIINYQNDVFGFMMDAITKRKGIVNQIMGDGFMATFGATVSAGNDCMEAYLAAREIMEMVNEKSARGEIPPTKIGIGLHAGYVVTGNVGSKNRKQFSVTGSAVIIAARLEQLNKEYGSTMVLSKDVYKHLPDDLRTPVKFEAVMVKGMSKPIEIATFC